jgi:hypothetical protein
VSTVVWNLKCHSAPVPGTCTFEFDSEEGIDHRYIVQAHDTKHDTADVEFEQTIGFPTTR